MRPYYTSSNYSMKNSVGYLMRMVVNRILPQMEALFVDQDFTFSQWTMLAALHDGRISTAGDLAHNICHDAGSLTRLVDQMEQRGFVNRQRSATDRRVVTLAITPRGRAVVEALAPRVMDLWNGLLAGFTHAEIDTLINLLTRLVIVAEGKPRPGARLRMSDAPLAGARKRQAGQARKKRKAS